MDSRESVYWKCVTDSNTGFDYTSSLLLRFICSRGYCNAFAYILLKDSESIPKSSLIHEVKERGHHRIVTTYNTQVLEPKKVNFDQLFFSSSFKPILSGCPSSTFDGLYNWAQIIKYRRYNVCKTLISDIWSTIPSPTQQFLLKHAIIRGTYKIIKDMLRKSDTIHPNIILCIVESRNLTTFRLYIKLNLTVTQPYKMTISKSSIDTIFKDDIKELIDYIIVSELFDTQPLIDIALKENRIDIVNRLTLSKQHA
jgi:hypothetical protein